MPSAILLIDCPDTKGLVATIANFLYSHNANIIHADQHQDSESGLFLMRVEWDLSDFALDMAQFDRQFAPIAEQFHMRWRLTLSEERPRIAILVSQYDHCLADLLYRHHSGELRCEIIFVGGNHENGKPLAEFYHVPFHYLPMTGKAEVEGRQLALLRDNN